MIPRYQTVLFVVLLAASVAMTVLLWRQLDSAHQRMLEGQSSAPTQAPQVAPAEPATLMVASDADGSLQPRVLSLPLPSLEANPGARARAILGRLLDLYAAPDSAHPVPGGAASVEQVFLLPEPANDPSPESANDRGSQNGPELAVVNLSGSFAANHPSGIETETLTVLSICATLRANLPRIASVRFLVDGQQLDTLAGHADLTRTYLTSQAVPAEGVAP
ncbi:MAG TPA: GerMN domain-containing protein [Terracidiphilus sp.]|nr:GerMN domain-containing protein [Terracidiphilus sp.]